MYIFIAGCGRSGTTLMAEMMRCLEGVHVVSEIRTSNGRIMRGKYEAPFTKMKHIYTDSPHLALKRTSRCHASLHALPSDIALIYCVRHPYDVLTSHHKGKSDKKFYISPERWHSEYEGLKRLRREQPGREIFFARYEFLVNNAVEFQASLSEFLQIPVAHAISDHPLGITPHRRSLDKWKSDEDRYQYIERLPNWIHGHIEEFGSQFGYDVRLNGVKEGASFLS